MLPNVAKFVDSIKEWGKIWDVFDTKGFNV